MIVYGVGAHLQDMLSWYPGLAARIERIFDKDPAKIGHEAPGCGKIVEPPEALRTLPAGTWVAISAIRHYAEIAREIRQINPRLRCLDIDDANMKSEEELKLGAKKSEESLTSDAVISSFRELLGREPESEQVIEYQLEHYGSVEALRHGIMNSDEYRVRQATLSAQPVVRPTVYAQHLAARMQAVCDCVRERRARSSGRSWQTYIY